MTIPLEAQGQPVWRGLNARQRMERDVSEMLGLARGLLADGVITEEEVKLLRAWMEAHPDAIRAWPGSVLWRRLERIFADGVITEEERQDLASLLEQLVGGSIGIVPAAGASGSTSLPLDDPPPELAFDGRIFVLTGRFAYGPRAACEREIRLRGGVCESNVTRRTHYLVVGTFGSRDWLHTSYGRKIERAVSLRDRYGAPAIVSEDHWAARLR